MVLWPIWCIEASAFYEHNKKSPGGAVTAPTYDSGTQENWSGTKYNFLLIRHENLYVFRKLKDGESKAKFKNSMKWW